MRGSMGIAYHVFATIWTVTLKERFDFGPKDHAYFMGWVGLWYALSQGVFAKLFIKYAGEDPSNVILVCVVILAFGRVLAMLTPSLFMMYGIMATVIVALGSCYTYNVDINIQFQIFNLHSIIRYLLPIKQE